MPVELPLDGSINNPNVTVGNGVSFGGGGAGVKNFELGNWKLDTHGWGLGTCAAQTSASRREAYLRLSGSAAQNLYSHGGTYLGQIDITNVSAGGVVFQDSMTVASLTAQQPGQLLTFAVNPSTVTVQENLGIGSGSGSLTLLRSQTPGTQWGLTLQNGASQALTHLDVQDSIASGGIALLANDGSSIDRGNNVNWNFGSARYWVSGVTGNWSNAANWATGIRAAPEVPGAPGAGFNAIFDANGLGNCNIDVPVSIAGLTISTVVGSGYAGQINTGGNVMTFSGNLTMNNGSFKANASSVTVAGNVTMASGIYTANTSTLSVTGNLSISPSVVFTEGQSNIILNGAGQSFTGNGNHLWSLSMPGSYTVAGTSVAATVDSLLILPGTATIASSLYMAAGSTLTFTGVLNGTGTFELQVGTPLGASGIVNSNLTWRLCSTPALAIGSRVYGGTVTVEDCGSLNLTATLPSGSFVPLAASRCKPTAAES